MEYGGGWEAHEGGQGGAYTGDRGTEKITPSAKLEALRAVERESAAREAKKMAGEDKPAPHAGATLAGRQQGAARGGGGHMHTQEHTPHGAAAARVRTGPALRRHEGGVEGGKTGGEEGGTAVAPVIEGVKQISLEGGRRASEGVAAGVEATGDWIEQVGEEASKAAVRGADTAVVSCVTRKLPLWLHTSIPSPLLAISRHVSERLGWHCQVGSFQ